MPSRSQTDNAGCNEIQQMDAPVERSSLQYPTPRLPNQKVSSHMGKSRLKPGKDVETNVDDVVKYMSNIPSYLQRLENGDNIQEKALNFGVLDWGRLEKWSYLQKQVDADIRGRNLQSRSNSSSSTSLSTFGSSSKSTRSVRSRSIQRKQSPTLNDLEQNRVQLTRNPESKTSGSRPSEEGKIRYLNTKCNSVDNNQPPDIGSSSSSNADVIQDLAHNKTKSHTSRSKGDGKINNCDQEGFSGHLNFAEDWLQDQCSVVEGVRDHLQECEHERGASHDSVTLNNDKFVEVSRKSFSALSGNFLTTDYHFTGQPPIPVSCPLSSTSMKLGQFIEGLSEKSAVNITNKSGEGKARVPAATRRELSPHRMLNAGLNKIRNLTSGEVSSGRQLKQTIVSDNSCEENSTFHGKIRRSLSPNRLLGGISRMRDFSSREGSSGKDMKQTTCSSNAQEENAASGGRSRRSPLRRMFDPLVKAKNQISVQLKSENEVCKLLDANINPILQDEKQVISTRHALLRLAWKDELPLFVFSTNDHDILAATMGKGCMSHAKDLKCNYTMFTAHETKKKGGLWMGQGNKRKNHDLVYNVVGQMRVASSKSTSFSPNDYHIMTEFVLLGNELAPTAHGCITAPFNTELAAIVIKVPTERPETKCSIQNMHFEQQKESLRVANVTAILPNGIHGISTKGNPSPLIERWKSGGSCDCGGWDEGCILTVLTDKIQESKRASSFQAFLADGTHRIELFPLVKDRENKHTFRMIAFKEGVYKVEFRASITLLQAFAMCIASLHSKNPRSLSGHRCSKAQSIASEQNPISYVPVHPPISPAGRA